MISLCVLQLNDMQRDKDELFERLQRVEGGAAERERELHRLRQENATLKHQLEDVKVSSLHHTAAYTHRAKLLIPSAGIL